MKRDLHPVDLMAAHPLMDEITAENDQALLEISIRERNQYFAYELEHGTYRAGTDLYAPCGCKGMVLGYPKWGERRLFLGEIEACEEHSGDYVRA
jgi:hypothetical protein